MKKILFILLITFCPFIMNDSQSLGSPSGDSSNSPQAQYGIYGEVYWPASGTPYNAVESPEVKIYKIVSGSWVYQGSAYASACGYYTYETSGTGTFKAEVAGNYYLRDYPNCTSRTDYSYYAGSSQTTIRIWDSWVEVDVKCN